MTSKMTPEVAQTLSAAEQHEWYRKAISRRSLLRGGLVGAGAVVAGPLLSLGSASAAEAPRSVGSASLHPCWQAFRAQPGNLVVPFGTTSRLWRRPDAADGGHMADRGTG